MNNDPYDSGTPKYKTAQAIYDGLCELAQAEEVNILSEIFSNVSYDGQDYYYTDKGYDLKEKFDELSGYGEKMWIMDLAVFLIDEEEIHDFVYEALINPELAKRLDFKKLFIDTMLHGSKHLYDDIAEAYLLELQELNRFEYYEMIKAYKRAMQACGRELLVNPYPNFCSALYKKAKNLRITQETQLIVECRALLTSYDDFMLGLRMNQALYEAQERQYRQKESELKSAYNEKIKRLYVFAEENGIVLDAVEFVKLLAE